MKQNVRVLVADGQEIVRSAMFRALLERDVFCDCVASGGDAITCLGDRDYAVMILDFALPHAGAAAVIETLRFLPAERRPIVIATAASGEGGSEGDTDLVQMIVRKPLRIRDLADMVESCVGQARTA